MRPFRPLVGFAVIALAIDLFSRSGVVSEYYFPRVTTIAGGVAELLTEPVFLGHVWATLWVSMLGIAVVFAIGCPLGVLLGASARVYRMTRALVEFLRPIPAVALIPVAIIAFGTGSQMKVAMIIAGAIWPILFNTMYGVWSADPVALDTARAYGNGPLRVLFRVAVPSAMPMIWTGVRISATIALILTISAEMLAGSERGIGAWLVQAGSVSADPYRVFAGTLLCGVLGWFLNRGLVLVQVRAMPWFKA